MRWQAVGFGTVLVNDVAAAIDLSTAPFTLTLNASAERLHAEALIVATGADSRWLGVEGEHAWRGQGVSSCATCDGFLYRGQVRR